MVKTYTLNYWRNRNRDQISEDWIILRLSSAAQNELDQLVGGIFHLRSMEVDFSQSNRIAETRQQFFPFAVPVNPV